ncbi:hypothetical protein KP509_18G017000 [Ceratopteris richardii]|uniref:Uncharacterized protein n=1 Tax=Ceratopteris richardii TaxID=49495 RepID=A0A8T2SRH5_CERRI|nr:hypothetical protein KP509_18G017000 [Ceratopteris richardii]
MAGGKGPPPDPVTVLRGHRASVTALKFLEPSLLVSGDLDGELKIWDLVKRRPHVSARVHNPASGVIGIGIDKKGGNKILSQGRDGTVKFWQLAEGSLSRYFIFWLFCILPCCMAEHSAISRYRVMHSIQIKC